MEDAIAKDDLALRCFTSGDFDLTVSDKMILKNLNVCNLQVNTNIAIENVYSLSLLLALLTQYSHPFVTSIREVSYYVGSYSKE